MKKHAINRRYVLLSGMAWVALATVGRSVKAAEAKKLEQKALMQFLSTVKSATGEFTQETRDRNGRVTATAEGQFAFLRPGSFDWLIEKPYRQRILSDAKTLWIYDEDLMQVTERAVADALPTTPAAVLFGEGRIPDGWRTETLPADATAVTLIPDVPAGGFEAVTIRFGDGALPVALELLDSFDQRTVIRFTRFTPQQVPQSRFAFTAPEGVEIVRDMPG